MDSRSALFVSLCSMIGCGALPTWKCRCIAPQMSQTSMARRQESIIGMVNKAVTVAAWLVILFIVRDIVAVLSGSTSGLGQPLRWISGSLHILVNNYVHINVSGSVSSIVSRPPSESVGQSDIQSANLVRQSRTVFSHATSYDRHVSSAIKRQRQLRPVLFRMMQRQTCRATAIAG